MTEMLTLGQAAKVAGVSKSTLARAIKAGKLTAIQEQDGWTYKIDPTALARVFGAQGSQTEADATPTSGVMDIAAAAIMEAAAAPAPSTPEPIAIADLAPTAEAAAPGPVPVIEPVVALADPMPAMPERMPAPALSATTDPAPAPAMMAPAAAEALPIAALASAEAEPASGAISAPAMVMAPEAKPATSVPETRMSATVIAMPEPKPAPAIVVSEPLPAGRQAPMLAPVQPGFFQRLLRRVGLGTVGG